MLSNRKALGSLLVALQFGCMLLLAVLALPAAARGAIAPACWLLAVASLALAVWILLHNRLGNFNIQPLPKQHGVLVTSGPYHWIRHPMYTTVMLGAAALALMSEPLPAWLTWICLAAVFGFLQTVGGAILGTLIGQQFNGTLTPNSAAYVVMALLVLGCILIAEKGRLFGIGKEYETVRRY